MTDELLSGRAGLLDCFQANLGVLADRLHGDGAHLRLGAVLRLRPRPGPDGLPTVEQSIDEVLADAADLLGLTVAAKWPGTGGAFVRSLRDCAWVIADAYHLPWVPYHRHRHVAHSFLVEPAADGIVVTDAYDNDTPWGAARPQQCRLRRDELAAVLDADPDATHAFRFSSVDLVPVAEETAAIPGTLIDGYLRAFAEHPDRALALDRFTMETWLLARSRRLRAAYLGDRAGGIPQQVREHLARWDGLAEQAYLASRRVARGRPEPPGLLLRATETLRGDALLLSAENWEFGKRPLVAAEETTISVERTVREVLGVHGPLDADADLRTMPEFNSLRMLEIVDRLEENFAIEFGAGELVPEKLRRVRDLAVLVRKTIDGDAG
ncbi:acyl carrier protein [Streptomyces sp. NPDC001508]|uniref:acyl carrier protein n=1 Tax=Streptomyces sp. NPDC001508 TaxID=3154656 RepID=UPI00331C5451